MIAAPLVDIIPYYRSEVSGELNSILEYWMNNTIDKLHGGFWGKVNNDNTCEGDAPKGVVLNSRILWAFSAAYMREKKQEYLDTAERSYRYIVDYFIDRKYGGVYWSVNNKGEMLDGRKQIYGLAFCLYGLSEYHKASGDRIALHIAKDLYEQIEKNSFDKNHGGYFEAFTQGWKPIDDLRLSEKDDNEKKTMNTHLHIIEAYANLATIWPNERVFTSIRNLLDVFDRHFIDKESGHLRLFMDEQWNNRSSLISYGHDIEAAWLLYECAKICGDMDRINQYRVHSLTMTEAAIEGLDADGGLWYEFDAAKDGWIKEKHSWPQAEAMIGFLNAWQLTGDEKYLSHSLQSWEFVKQHLKDNDKGEWFWGVCEDYSVMQKEKAGFWKCPYHNTRACLEVLKRTASFRQ
jgi:mannobiose 2-epimerase